MKGIGSVIDPVETNAHLKTVLTGRRTCKCSYRGKRRTEDLSGDS